MNSNVCQQIIEEIKQMQSGTVFTVKELLDKYNVEQDFQLRFDYTHTILNEIKDFAEIHEGDKNAFLGPAFVFRYVKK